jgi:hypothetical protein
VVDVVVVEIVLQLISLNRNFYFKYKEVLAEILILIQDILINFAGNQIVKNHQFFFIKN